MRYLFTALLGLALATGAPTLLNAARNSDPAAANRLELLVIQVAGCTVCDLVRLHIQPAYEESPRSKQVPMRYVDITNIDEIELGLNRRVVTVPTIVLMQDGKEVDRISGYTGPKHFFVALTDMLQQVVN